MMNMCVLPLIISFDLGVVYFNTYYIIFPTILQTTLKYSLLKFHNLKFINLIGSVI